MKRALLALSICAGLALAAEGAWIPAKAKLAQVLLGVSWKSGGSVKPWPWADTRAIAKLTIDRDTVIVLSGASGRTMAFGPGHLDGSAMPGDAGNCVITAHRDTHFSALRYVVAGDVLTLERPRGVVSHYEVVDTRVVDKSDTSVLAPTGDERLTLITCYPFNSVIPGGPLRYVVVANRITD